MEIKFTLEQIRAAYSELSEGDLLSWENLENKIKEKYLARLG